MSFIAQGSDLFNNIHFGLFSQRTNFSARLYLSFGRFTVQMFVAVTVKPLFVDLFRADFLLESFNGPFEKTTRKDSQLNQHHSFHNNTHPQNHRLKGSAYRSQPRSRGTYKSLIDSAEVDDWNWLDGRNTGSHFQNRSLRQTRFSREEKSERGNSRQQLLHSSPSLAGKENLAVWNFENRSQGSWKKLVTVEEKTKTWQHWTAPKDRKYIEVDDRSPRSSLSADSLLDDDPFQDQVILERGSSLSASSGSEPAAAAATSVTDDSSSSSCDELLCQGGGSCSQDAASGRGHCRCPLGTSGPYCEKGQLK